MDLSTLELGLLAKSKVNRTSNKTSFDVVPPSHNLFDQVLDRITRCVSTTWYGCLYEKTLLFSNILATVLLFYMVAVYIFNRGKSVKDLQVILMIVGLINGLFVGTNELVLSFGQRL